MSSGDDVNAIGYTAPLLMVSDKEIRNRVPSKPPELLLTGQDGDPPVAATLSAADWRDLTPDIHIPIPEDSVEWPEPVERGGRTTITFQSDARPFWFDVAMGTEVDPTTGLPIDSTTGQEVPRVHDFKYRVGGREDAPMRHEDGTFSIECLPSEVFPEEFVVVFVAWKVYTESLGLDAEQGSLGGEVYGNWILHFVNE